jgi:hypothetical protein
MLTVLLRRAVVPRAPQTAGLFAKALSTLVPSTSDVTFTRCAHCGKSLEAPALVCSGCRCKSFCGPACQEAHAGVHESECDDMARYFQRDVRVHLPSNPQWLTEAMDHDCSMSFCSLLETMNIHEGGYKLLCGCQGAPSPFTELIEPLPTPERPIALGSVTGWESYYDARGLSPESPVSALLSFPLTVYDILSQMDFEKEEGQPVRVHLLGHEKELFLLPLFRELLWLMPTAHLEIEMVGPVAFDLPEKPVVYDGPVGGRVAVRAHRSTYHLLALEAQLPKPDLVVALNAGLAAAGYNWSPSLQLVHRLSVPFFFTDYSEYSAERAAAFAEKHGLRQTSPVTLNPFRAPLRQPLVAGGSVGFPWLSNGFIAGFNA